MQLSLKINAIFFQFFIAAKTCLLLLTLGDVNYWRAVALKPLQLSSEMSFVKKIDCFFLYA